MPLTDSGREVLGSFQKKYGSKKGEAYFYASIHKNVPGSDKWHGGKSVKKSNPYTKALMK